MPNTFGLIDPSDPEIRDETAVALATLVGGSGGGSSKKLGAKMIVGRSGKIIGGVTIGGCVDAQVVEAADALAVAGGTRLLSISLDDDEAWEIGLTCAGTLDVLLTRVEPRSPTDPTMLAHRRALELLDAGEAVVIVTPFDASAAPRTIPAAELDRVAESGVFLDRVSPPLTLVIVGAGQVAMTLTRLARDIDVRTVIVDGRERYATADRFPNANEIRVGMPSEIVASIAPTKNVGIVLVAHDYKYELPVLRHALREPVGYIGMLGSRKRGAAVRELLASEGFTAEDLSRLHTPIGLDLGGKRPEEVALSILAEVVAVRNGKQP